MLLVAEIASLIFGIITVATGIFTLTRNKVCYGAPARAVGVLLMLPLPVAILVTIAVIAMLAARGGVTGPRDVPGWIGLLELLIFLVFFVPALVIAGVNGRPPRPARRPEDEDRGPPRRPVADVDEDIPVVRPVRRPPDDHIRE